MLIDFSFASRDGWVGYKHEITDSPPRDSFSLHTHNWYELIYFVRGDATHVIEDRKYKLKQGDLILARPLKSHFIQIDSSATYERFNIGFDESLLGGKISSLLDEGVEVINLQKDSGIEEIFNRIDYYRQNLSCEEMGFLFPSVLRELLYSIMIASRGESVRPAMILNPILSKAVAYINESLSTVKSISEVSEHLFITESYLIQLFKRELHQTPKRYINSKRLLLAQTMLRRGERPTDVYARCGFSDYTVFYRSYKNFFGKPPSEDSRGK